jgi:hypothetical protein
MTKSRRRAANRLAVVDVRAALDAQVSPLALRLYIAVMAAGAWHTWVDVRTRDYADLLAASAEAIRAALRCLSARGYLCREVHRGARLQRVRAPEPSSR